jgi:hypothetical protein
MSIGRIMRRSVAALLELSPCSSLSVLDPQRGVSRDHVEVSVEVEQGGALADRHGRDDAVDHAAHGLTLRAARALDDGSLLPCVEPTHPKHPEGKEVTPDADDIDIWSARCEQLHDDGFGDRRRFRLL